MFRTVSLYWSRLITLLFLTSLFRDFLKKRENLRNPIMQHSGFENYYVILTPCDVNTHGTDKLSISWPFFLESVAAPNKTDGVVRCSLFSS